MADENKKRLSDLNVGEKGEVIRLECDGTMRRRLLDMGFAVGACVEKMGESPSSDPSAYLVRGAVIALRKKDGASIYLNAPMRGEDELWD